MNTAQWIQVALALAAIIATGGFVALLHVRKQGRVLDTAAQKSAADAASIITSAATNLIAPLDMRITNLSGEVAELRGEMRVRDQLAAEHSGWDHLAELELNRRGVNIGERPPLYPPPRHAATQTLTVELSTSTQLED